MSEVFVQQLEGTSKAGGFAWELHGGPWSFGTSAALPIKELTVWCGKQSSATGSGHDLFHIVFMILRLTRAIHYDSESP